MEKTWTYRELELREEIAKTIESKLMPLCICNKCGNLVEAQIVSQAAQIARNGK